MPADRLDRDRVRVGADANQEHAQRGAREGGRSYVVVELTPQSRELALEQREALDERSTVGRVACKLLVVVHAVRTGFSARSKPRRIRWELL